MAYMLKKRGKFMSGHSYATGFGRSYSWTVDETAAIRFADDSSAADMFCGETGAKVVRVPNNRKELRALGRRLMRAREARK